MSVGKPEGHSACYHAGPQQHKTCDIRGGAIFGRQRHNLNKLGRGSQKDQGLHFLIWSSGSPFVQWSRTICAILVEGIMRNNFVIFFEFGPKVQEEMPFIGYSDSLFVQRSRTICAFLVEQWFRRRCRLKDFLSGALVALIFSRAEPFMQFWKGASWGTF